MLIILRRLWAYSLFFDDQQYYWTRVVFHRGGMLVGIAIVFENTVGCRRSTLSTSFWNREILNIDAIYQLFRR